MEGADDNIKTNIGGDGDVKDGDSPPDHLHRQGGRISEEVASGTSTSSTDGDLEGEEEYLEVHHQFRGRGGGVGSASVDEFPGHVPMMKKSCEITVGEGAAAEKTSAGAGAGDDDDFAIRTASKYYYGQLHYYYDNHNNINAAQRSPTTTSEIVVVGDEDVGDGEGSSQFSLDFHNHHHHHGSTSSSYHNHSQEEEGEEDAVYVAVSSSSTSSSMDALLWTLNHAILHPSSTTVFLVHVFPQIRHIPTPCKY